MDHWGFLHGERSDDGVRIRLRKRSWDSLVLVIHGAVKLARLRSVLLHRLLVDLSRPVQDLVVLLRIGKREPSRELLLVIRALERHAPGLHLKKLDLLLLLFLLLRQLRELANVLFVDDDVASVVGSLAALPWLCAILPLVHYHLRSGLLRVQLLFQESSAFLLVFGEKLRRRPHARPHVLFWVRGRLCVHVENVA